jgi:hypothetical protein
MNQKPVHVIVFIKELKLTLLSKLILPFQIMSTHDLGRLKADVSSFAIHSTF